MKMKGRIVVVGILMFALLCISVNADSETDLMAQKCATTYLTNGTAKQFPSWFELIAYLDQASDPPRAEFESTADYEGRLRTLERKRVFQIQFVPVLDQYSLEEHGFAFRLSFFHQEGGLTYLTRGLAAFPRAHLMTSEKWPTDVSLWVYERFEVYDIRETNTPLHCLLVEVDIAQAKKIREAEATVTATFSGILEKVEQTTRSFVVRKNDVLLYRALQYDLPITVYTIRPIEMVVVTPGRTYTWKF